MDEKKYIDSAKKILNDFVLMSGENMKTVAEDIRQVLAGYCFGALTAYSMEQKVNHAQIQAVMISVLVQTFDYSVQQAVDCFAFLVKCTKREEHPVMFAIIHRGMEGYYMYKDGKRREASKDLNEVIDLVIGS